MEGALDGSGSGAHAADGARSGTHFGRLDWGPPCRRTRAQVRRCERKGADAEAATGGAREREVIERRARSLVAGDVPREP